MASQGILGELSPYFIYILIVSTIGPLLFGYHLAELNAPETVITCQAKSIPTLLSHLLFTRETDDWLPQCIQMNKTQFAIVTSFFTLGGLVGALASGSLSDQYGRLRVMLITSIFFVTGAAVESLASSVAIMTIGRFLSGIGAGASVVVVPLYVSEAAPPARRGFFGTFTQIMVNIGILIAQVLGYFLSRGSLWRIILAVGGAIGLSQAIGLILGGQESPRWTAENGNVTAAKRALQKLRGKKTKIEDEMVAWQVAEADHLNDEEQRLLDHDAENVGLLDGAGPKNMRRGVLTVFTVVKDPDARPAIFAIVMIMLAQQLTGINSIVMYGVGLLADLLGSNASLLNILVAVLNIITTVIAAPLVDRLGRKPCLLISITGMGVNAVLLGIGMMQHIPPLSAIAVILFVASFGLGLGPVPFMLSPELVNSEAVGATQSWALAANWIATFAVAQFFPIVDEAMGKGQVYFLFAGFALFFGTFVAWYVPETKGKKTADEVWGRAKAAVE